MELQFQMSQYFRWLNAAPSLNTFSVYRTAGNVQHALKFYLTNMAIISTGTEFGWFVFDSLTAISVMMCFGTPICVCASVCKRKIEKGSNVDYPLVSCKFHPY